MKFTIVLKIAVLMNTPKIHPLTPNPMCKPKLFSKLQLLLLPDSAFDFPTNIKNDTW